MNKIRRALPAVMIALLCFVNILLLLRLHALRAEQMEPRMYLCGVLQELDIDDGGHALLLLATEAGPKRVALQKDTQIRDEAGKRRRLSDLELQNELYLVVGTSVVYDEPETFTRCYGITITD